MHVAAWGWAPSHLRQGHGKHNNVCPPNESVRGEEKKKWGWRGHTHQVEHPPHLLMVSGMEQDILREREREGSSLSSLKAGRLVQMCNVVETYELTSMQASPANAGGSA